MYNCSNDAGQASESRAHNLGTKIATASLSGIIMSVFTFVVIKEFVVGQDTTNWSSLEQTVILTLFPLAALIIGFIGVFRLVG